MLTWKVCSIRPEIIPYDTGGSWLQPTSAKHKCTRDTGPASHFPVTRGKPRLHLYGPGQAPAVFLPESPKSLQHAWARHTFRTKACCLVITSLVLGQKRRMTEHLFLSLLSSHVTQKEKHLYASESTLTSWQYWRTSSFVPKQLWVPAGSGSHLPVWMLTCMFNFPQNIAIWGSATANPVPALAARAYGRKTIPGSLPGGGRRGGCDSTTDLLKLFISYYFFFIKKSFSQEQSQYKKRPLDVYGQQRWVRNVTPSPHLDTSDLGTDHPPAVPSKTSKSTSQPGTHQARVQNDRSSRDSTQFTHTTKLYWAATIFAQQHAKCLTHNDEPRIMFPARKGLWSSPQSTLTQKVWSHPRRPEEEENAELEEPTVQNRDVT